MTTATQESIELRTTSNAGTATVAVSHPQSATRSARWPIVAASVLVFTGFLYSLVWGPLVQHGSHWVVPGDIWATFRAAHYVGWGDIGDVYGPLTGLVTFPLIAVVLAPVALLSGHLGLSESLPFFLPHPSAWLLLGPVELAIGASTLFPLDALGERIGITRPRRILLLGIETALLWPVVAIWGHPEDALAMTFGLWGLMAALDGRWTRCGWMWGLAIAAQPLVVLMLPVVFGMSPLRRWPGIALRTAAPALALLAVPLVQSWADTSRALFQQPNYPSVDHPTPWAALAPVLSSAHRIVSTQFSQVHTPHGVRFTTSLVTGTAGRVIAAGPGRLIALLLSIGMGVWVNRRRPVGLEVMWLCGLALSLRCVFESVMNPYYLWPPLALLVLVVACSSWWRFAMTGAAAFAVTVYSYHRTGPWAWYLPVMVLLATAVMASWPSQSRRMSGHHSGRPSSDALPGMSRALPRRILSTAGTSTSGSSLPT